MSTKYFRWDGGASKAIGILSYVEGNPVEFIIHQQPQLALQAWHGISPPARTALIARLSAEGWVEGEQSKSDPVRNG